MDGQTDGCIGLTSLHWQASDKLIRYTREPQLMFFFFWEHRLI